MADPNSPQNVIYGRPYIFPGPAGTTRQMHTLAYKNERRLIVSYSAGQGPAAAAEINRVTTLVGKPPITYPYNNSEYIVIGEYIPSSKGYGLGVFDARYATDSDNRPAQLGGISNKQIFDISNSPSPQGFQALNLATAGIPLDALPPNIVPQAAPNPLPAPQPGDGITTPIKELPENSQGSTVRGTAGSALPAQAEQTRQTTPEAAPQQTPATAPATEAPAAQPATPAEKTYLSYPSNIKAEQDRIRFQAVELGNRNETTPDASKGQGALDFRFGVRNFVPAKDQKPIFMAIQSSITDQNSVDWGPDSINAIDSALYYKSYGAMKDNKDLAAELSKFGTDIAIAFKKRQGYFQRYLAGQAAGNSNILARTDGVLLNPNMELLFQGPQLRPFTFQFKMSARDSKEALEIRQIIGYFKKNMAVKKGDDGFFLRSPNLFQISYLKWDGKKYVDHTGLNIIHSYNGETKTAESIRACALTNCSVDYTPLGSYATYSDGTMVAYNLSLQFQDVIPIYQEDYNANSTHPIGY